MVKAQHICAKCGSEQIQRNGHSGGHARYRCTSCGHQARFVPAATERAARYGQVEKLLAERNSQRRIVRVTGVSHMTVAWVLGRRDAATARRLWVTLPKRYRRHCWYFTDLFPAYAQAFPTGSHRPCPKGEGQTNMFEALNCSLRQRCGVLVRKSCSFSKSLAMHTARIKICIDRHNQTTILN